ncbi:MAG: asparagine synthase (glutamine-hydrolyzing) [Acidobacteria bacterium]|nr:asparagine synthase (glutamine-hydrolyzing) [Acidobacteriota bacterium]
MCGIAGYFRSEAATNGRTNGSSPKDYLIERMCDVITHRGPDDAGYYVEAGLAIGMRRLSIIDIVAGHQPISNEDGSVWIVFNGEIYNFATLRDDLIARGHTFKTHSDTETIVHLYEEEGEWCVERLRGMFAFAIWDQRQNSLFLARDRAGKKPLHYTMVGDTLVFGSEIKSLLQFPGIERRANLNAISDFLTFGYVPDPLTAFGGIHKLPAGHTMTFRDGRVKTRRYWDFNYDSAERNSHHEEQFYVERLRELIAEAVRVRLVSEVPLGAFLSGGIDSSTVVAMMARAMDQPVKTFSIGFSEASFDELKYARLTAERYQTDHHEFIVTPDVCRLVEEIVWHHDEPFADASSIPTYVVSKMAREFVTVILSGDGGDELFAGYERYRIHQGRGGFERIPRRFRRGLMLPLSRALPRAVYGKQFLRNISLEGGARFVDSLSYFSADVKRSLLTGATRRALNGHDSTVAFEQIYAEPNSADSIERLLYLDSKTYLVGDILTKVDRMSMAHSIEARVPLLDQELIEFVQTIPASLKLRGQTTKHILKQAMAELIPAEIINRPKMGFGVPLRKWLNHELREMLHDTLTDETARQRGLLDPRAVQALLDEHERGRRDNSLHLWGLLTLELWHRSFIDRKPEMSFAGAKQVKLQQLAVGAGA